MKRTSDRRRKAGPREWFALALESWHPDSGLVVYPERLRPRETSGEHVLGSAAGETRRVRYPAPPPRGFSPLRKSSPQQGFRKRVKEK